SSNFLVRLINYNVDTHQVFTLLVNDCINCDGRLARLAVTNDQLTLTTPDGDHTVNGLDTRLYRCVHAFSRDDAWSNALNWACLICNNRSTVVDWFTQRVDYTTDQCIANRDRDNAAGGTHF